MTSPLHDNPSAKVQALLRCPNCWVVVADAEQILAAYLDDLISVYHIWGLYGRALALLRREADAAVDVVGVVYTWAYMKNYDLNQNG